MDQPKKTMMVFVKTVIYYLSGPGGMTVFTALEAQYDEKKKEYYEGQDEYRFVASDKIDFSGIRSGDRYEVAAQEDPDSPYGIEWRVTEATRKETVLFYEIRKFLRKFQRRGMTPRRIEKLLAKYGANTLGAILADPDALDFLNLQPHIKAGIFAALQENKDFIYVLEYLIDRKADCRQAAPICKQYEDQAILKITGNPYTLFLDELTDFRTADRIHLAEGKGPNDPLRCRHAIIAALRYETEKTGNVFIPRTELRAKIAPLLADAFLGAPLDECSITESDISNAVAWLQKAGQTYADHSAGYEAIYLKSLYDAEYNVAHKLKALCQTKKKIDCNPRKLDTFLENFRTKGGSRLTPRQCKAVRQMLTSPVSVLTGGPGTGKTVLVSCAVKALEKLHPRANIKCCAPTGKAADNMPGEACTIHRLVKMPEWLHPERYQDDDNSNEKEAVNILFMDEASMVDIDMCSQMILGLPDNARLVVVGDPNQLPSIGPGQVLRDLIASGRIPTIALTELFRQKEGGGILEAAAKIMETADDEDIHLEPSEGTGKDFYFNKIDGNPHEIVKNILRLWETLKERGLGAEDIQVIARQRSGELGTENLNRLLQSRFNPQPPENIFTYGNREFRLGDRVIHVKNNYQEEIYNGTVGVITEIHKAKEDVLTVSYPSKEVHYPAKGLNELELAYAMTVHKSQGSEYPVVIIPVAGKGFTRRLLYTAVTRGKAKVALIGTEDALTAAQRNEPPAERASNLVRRLQALLPPVFEEMEQQSLFPDEVA